MTATAGRLALPTTAAEAGYRSPGATACWLGHARTLLAAGACEAAHAHALGQLTGPRQPRPPAAAEPRPLPDALALLALCDRRTAVLDVLGQHTHLLPAVGAPGRDRAIAAVIDAVSDPRARADHRPDCQYRTQRHRLRWDQVRAQIRQLEYTAHLPQHSAGPAQPTTQAGANHA